MSAMSVSRAKKQLTESLLSEITKIRKERAYFALEDFKYVLDDNLSVYLGSLIQFDATQDFEDDCYFYIAKALLINMVVYKLNEEIKALTVSVGGAEDETHIKRVVEVKANAVTNAINNSALPSLFEGIQDITHKSSILSAEYKTIYNKSTGSTAQSEFAHMVGMPKGAKDIHAIAVPISITLEIFIERINEATTIEDVGHNIYQLKKTITFTLLTMMDAYTGYVPPAQDDEKTNIYKLITAVMLTDLLVCSLERLSDVPADFVRTLTTKICPPYDAPFNADIPDLQSTNYYEMVRPLLTELIEFLQDNYTDFNKAYTIH